MQDLTFTPIRKLTSRKAVKQWRETLKFKINFPPLVSQRGVRGGSSAVEARLPSRKANAGVQMKGRSFLYQKS